MHNRGKSYAILAGAVLAISSPLSAAPLFTANFDSTDPLSIRNYAGGTHEQANVYTTIDGLDVRIPSGFGVDVVSVSDGNNALRLVDNSSSGNQNFYARYQVPDAADAISTTGTGNNIITGSFEYTRLTLPSGTAGSFRFFINQAEDVQNVQTAYLRINGGQIQYANGTGGTSTVPAPDDGGVTIDYDITYKIHITVDLSSDSQDVWKFSVADTEDSVLWASDWMNTRSANILPSAFVFNGGVNGTPTSASPYAQIDNIQFSVVPEPAGALVAGLGLMGLVARRRRTM